VHTNNPRAAIHSFANGTTILDANRRL
jgi:hypothetical protein